jgi:hypothetical protein
VLSVANFALSCLYPSQIIEYDLDGADIDYEDFTAFENDNGDGVTWLIDFTKEMRNKLPVGNYILTHARVFISYHDTVWTTLI